MCDGIKTYALGYWMCVLALKPMHTGTGYVMVLNVCTRVLDMCDGIKTFALGYWICVMVLKPMHSGTGYVWWY